MQTSTNDPNTTEAQPASEEGNAQLRELAGWVEAAERFWKPCFEQIRQDAKFAAGVINIEGEEQKKEDDAKLKDTGEVRVNLIFATVQGLMPHVYAKNPELSFGPDEGVAQHELQPVKAFANSLQTGVNRSLRKANLKGLAKSCARTAMVRSLGWTKIAFQREFETDPIISQRIADTQDNLRELNARIEALRDRPDELQDEETQRAELVDTLKALEGAPEVVVSQGITLDKVEPDHLLMDPSVKELRNWRKGRRVAEFIFMPKKEAESSFGADAVKGAKEYSWQQFHDDEKGDNQNGQTSTTGGQQDPMVKVIELWDRTTLTVYTWVHGANQWAKEPWAPQAQGEGWYPYQELAFYTRDGYVWPLNLVRLMYTLQHEHERSRTQQSEHRELSKPTYVADATTDMDTLRRQSDKVLGEIVLVDAKGRPLDQVVQAQTPPPYNAQVYDLRQNQVDSDLISGLSDAARGGVNRAKTLGEAQILAAGVEGRSSEIRDTIEDWLERIAKFAAELLMLNLNPQEAARVAGSQALMTWPLDADKQDLFDLINVDIAAGSSGAPDKVSEQETWSKALPIIESLQDKIIELVAMQIDPSHKIELLRQTLRRLDETIEIETLIPPQAMPYLNQAAGPENALMQAMGGTPGMGGMGGAPGMGGMPGMSGPPPPMQDNVIEFPPGGAAFVP